MSSQPYAPPGPPSTASFDLATVFQPLAERAGWLKFIGVWMIIVGVMYSLSIIGAIVGVPVIIAGVNLMQAGGLLKTAYNNAGQMREACSKMSTSALIMGILLAISLGLMVMYLLAIFALMVLGGIGAGMNMQ